MKYTIHGFQQSVLCQYGLDNNDALLLRWFIDFQNTGKMATIIIDNTPYYWVKYQGVINDLPCLNITNKESIARRFDKFVKKGVLVKHIKKDSNGTYSLFSISKNYLSLIENDTHPTQKSTMHDAKVEPPPDAKVEPKDSSININHSTNNNIQASPAPSIFDNHIDQPNIIDNQNPAKPIDNKTDKVKATVDKSNQLNNLTKQVIELFDKANINLTGKKLSWVGKGEQYGRNIKLIIQAAENDFDEIRKRAAKYYEQVKTDDFQRKQGFTPSSLLSNWNKLADIKRNAKSLDAKEKLFPDWQNMTDQEIETVFNDKKFPFQTHDILPYLPEQVQKIWKAKGFYFYGLSEILIKYKRGEYVQDNK